jgi:hypothetical protein
MANLYGWVEGDRSKTIASRLANDQLTVAAETWQSRVTVHAYDGGAFRVYLSEKDGENQRLLIDGNMDIGGVIHFVDGQATEEQHA